MIEIENNDELDNNNDNVDNTNTTDDNVTNTATNNAAQTTGEDDDKDVTDMSRDELENNVEELKKENDKYYKHLQRTAAEFDNFKKRVSKEKDAIYSLAVGDTVAKFVNVLDNIDRALAVESADDKMKEGISLIKKQMLEIMTELGCSEIPTVGEVFNPEVHDAVMHIESEEYGEQVIVEELRKGYKCGDRVIRHAMVKVAN